MENIILFLGDSITDCGRTYSENVSDGLGEGYVSMVAERLASRCPVVNRGFDGFTAPDVLRQWRRFMANRPSGSAPRTVSVLVGINDAAIAMSTGYPENRALDDYEETLSELASEIRDLGCGLMMLEPFVFPWPAELMLWEPCVRRFSERLSRVADKYGALFVPLQRSFDEALCAGTDYSDITLDGVHLTAAGHRILAQRWLEEYSQLIRF